MGETAAERSKQFRCGLLVLIRRHHAHKRALEHDSAELDGVLGKTTDTG